jgi:hypothetical protein
MAMIAIGKRGPRKGTFRQYYHAFKEEKLQMNNEP